MNTICSLGSSCPGPAIRVPTDIFVDECFLRELSSFLVRMDIDRLDSTPTTVTVLRKEDLSLSRFAKTSTLVTYPSC